MGVATGGGAIGDLHGPPFELTARLKRICPRSHKYVPRPCDCPRLLVYPGP